MSPLWPSFSNPCSHGRLRPQGLVFQNVRAALSRALSQFLGVRGRWVAVWLLQPLECMGHWVPSTLWSPSSCVCSGVGGGLLPPGTTGLITQIEYMAQAPRPAGWPLSLLSQINTICLEGRHGVGAL